VLGVDTGGTFTDFYLIGDDGAASVYKRPSTPDDPARAVLEGLRELEALTAPGSTLAGVDVVHGSTVATNAIIERKGARTALITTKGFRDVLVIGRQTRPRIYDLEPQREPPLVPHRLRFEATERLDHRGSVLRPLDPAEVEHLLDRAQRGGAESLAVCFLFSFLNANHERLVAAAARRRGLAVSASHEVLPEHREYERTSTTVANAYVSPLMARYLSGLERGLGRRGVSRLRVMVSNGGSTSAETAAKIAVRTALSGPAGGVAGAFAIARLAGFDRVITLDMGGTSTDVSVCPGRILERDETTVGGLPVRGPTVDVLSVGAGGGSIARIDEGGALRVGPESAGADPGPACYGKSDRPTVTDAHVVLGRIDPRRFLGGRMRIRPDLSLLALRRIAAPYDGDPQRAAVALLRVANANMERALRVVSVERGHDPRDFTLLAFGGAGPLHACELAEALRIPRVLVPLYPGVLSAAGMARAPVVRDLSAPVLARVPAGRSSTRLTRRLAAIRDRLSARGRRELEREGFLTEALSLETILEMRYVGQSYELAVRVDELAPERFLPLFHAAHAERYAYSDPERAVEVVTLRVKLTVPVRTPDGGRRVSRASPRPHPVSRSKVWFGDRAVTAPVYDRAQLGPGAAVRGPALVVQMDSTTVVPLGWRGAVDGESNLVLEKI
jgi:N-methylhydantoinase A